MVPSELWLVVTLLWAIFGGGPHLISDEYKLKNKQINKKYIDIDKSVINMLQHH